MDYDIEVVWNGGKLSPGGPYLCIEDDRQTAKECDWPNRERSHPKLPRANSLPTDKPKTLPAHAWLERL